MQAVSFEVGVTPAVPPSELIRYLNTHNRPERFTTPSLAAHLHLTVQEAQDTLNRYADEGLVAYAGEPDGIESWTTTQEGRRVLLHHKARWTKKSLSAALAALSAEPADLPITEISVAGRALAGAANGTLVVGLRFARTPYSDPEDLAVIRRVLGVIEAAATRPGSVAILLFHATVPHRLRHRQVLVGDDAGMTLSTDDAQVDHDESVYRAAVNALLKSLKPVRRPAVPDEDEWAWMLPMMPSVHPALYGLQTHFYYESLDTSFPMEGRRSPLRLLHDTRHELATALSTFEWLSDHLRDKRWDRWDYGEARSLLALADYHLARGTFPAFVSSIEDDRFDRMSLREMDSSERQQEILARLYLHYETIAARRQQSKAGKSKPPGPVHYYAVFDCLNGVEPVLVGFVRQPLSHRANISDVEELWYGVLKGPDKTIGGALQEAGLNGVGLSLRYRLATELETAAFDAVSARVGGTLKFILRTGMGRLARERYSNIDVGIVPPELKEATWGGRPITMLVIGSMWRTRIGTTLFDVIRKLPEPHRGRARARLLDMEEVAMRDFAANASDPKTSDPVVIASGLLDGWRFEADGARWKAALAADTWSVTLEGERNKLTLLLDVDGCEHTTQLAPFKEGKHSYRSPYRGRLSSVNRLMTYLLALKEDGADRFTEQYGDGGLTVKDIDWYLDVINRILQGFNVFDSGDWTRWPYLSRTDEGSTIE